MPTTLICYDVTPPAKWRAGFTGAERTPFYFGCAGCDAKDPEIAGFIGTGPTFAEVGVVKTDGFFVKPALYCGACWQKRQGVRS